MHEHTWEYEEFSDSSGVFWVAICKGDACDEGFFWDSRYSRSLPNRSLSGHPVQQRELLATEAFERGASVDEIWEIMCHGSTRPVPTEEVLAWCTRRTALCEAV